MAQFLARHKIEHDRHPVDVYRQRIAQVSRPIVVYRELYICPYLTGVANAVMPVVCPYGTAMSSVEQC